MYVTTQLRGGTFLESHLLQAACKFGRHLGCGGGKRAIFFFFLVLFFFWGGGTLPTLLPLLPEANMFRITPEYQILYWYIIMVYLLEPAL